MSWFFSSAGTRKKNSRFVRFGEQGCRIPGVDLRTSGRPERRRGASRIFRRFLACALPAAIAGVVAALAAVPPRGPNVIREAAPQAAAVPVLVELFTPEGCAGCPAADEMLRKLEEEQPVPGAEIVILDEHLDFSSGWREPQSARAMTNRQIDYGRLFRNDNIFEPQFIIGGRTQLLGMESVNLRQEIAREAKTQKVAVEVSFQSASVATIKIERLPDEAPASEVWMAITESNMEAAAGESGKPKVRHSGVVRSLVMLGRVDPTGPITFSMHLRFNPRWKRDDLKYVVFVQDRLTRRVWGATAVTP
jgi:hypothetical protein